MAWKWLPPSMDYSQPWIQIVLNPSTSPTKIKKKKDAAIGTTDTDGISSRVSFSFDHGGLRSQLNDISQISVEASTFKQRERVRGREREKGFSCNYVIELTFFLIENCWIYVFWFFFWEEWILYSQIYFWVENKLYLH